MPRFILHPKNRFKQTWQIIFTILLIYTAVFVPFKLAFIEDETAAIKIFEYFVDIFFGIDIVINFFSAIE